MSMPEADAQLPLKKRARRRLVGAIALAVLAAVVLPMVMDQAPQAPVQDVQIRIPGQEQAPPFSPKSLAAKPAEAPPAAKSASAPAVEKPAVAASEKPADKPVEKVAEKAPEKPTSEAAKPTAKTEKKPAEKAVEKPAEKTPEKPVAAKNGGDDSQRAAAILAGKPAETAPAQKATGSEFVILIGAFSNPANVKQLQTKLSELGLKVYTETLDSPQGKKTRVRAGPFPSRDAADKALEKMKRIGVNGVVAPK
jgi:DedD protein